MPARLWQMMRKTTPRKRDDVSQHILPEVTQPASVTTTSGCPTTSGPEPDSFTQHPPWNKMNAWLLTIHFGPVPLHGTLATYLFYRWRIHILGHCIYSTKSVSIHMNKKSIFRSRAVETT